MEAEVSVLVSLVILYTPLLGKIGAGGGAGGRIAAADASWMSTHLLYVCEAEESERAARRVTTCC